MNSPKVTVTKTRFGVHTHKHEARSLFALCSVHVEVRPAVHFINRIFDEAGRS